MHIHDRDLLGLTATIRTPENLELTYALAGAGSRAAAYIIDCLILLFSVQLLGNLIAVVLTLPFDNQWRAAIGGMLFFAFFNGYFMFFEWLLNGQTPGKRLIGIRVIKQGGYALTFLDVLLRNLMRFVDFLPVLYGVGAASLLLTSRCQRLGDLVAGTLVVRQDALSTLDLAPAIPEATATEPQFSPAQLSAIPGRLVDLAVEFFSQRDLLAPRYRQQIAVELTDLISRTGAIEIEPTQSAESLLAAVIRQSGRSQTETSAPDSPIEPPSWRAAP